MLQEIWALVVSMVLAFVPGAAVLLCARQRGWTLVAAPLVTYGIVTVGGVVCAWVGLPWSVWTLLLSTVVLAGIALGVTRFVPRFLPAAPAVLDEDTGARAVEDDDAGRSWSAGRRRAHVLVAACAAVGGLFGAFVLRRGMGTLDAVVQDWDGVFHGAVTRWIIESRDMSQPSLAQLNNRDTPDAFYYPDAWHGLAALGSDLGVDWVPRLLNAGSLMMPILLAFGVAALVLQFTRNPVAAGASAILVSMPSALVFDVLWRGPLIPFAVGLAMVPALVVLFERTLDRRTPGLLLVTGIAAGGVVGVHPSGVYAALVFLVPWILQRWFSRRAGVVLDLLAILAVGVVAALVAAPSLLAAVRADTGAVSDWPAVQTAGQAIGDALMLNHARPSPQWAIVALAFVGVFSLRRYRGLWWFWVSGAVALGLFVLAAAYDTPLAADLTGPWWNDRWRFAAMVALFVAVAAGIGVASVVENVPAWISARTPLGLRAATAGVLVLLVAGFAVTSRGGYVEQNSARMYGNFQSGAVIGEDDLALWERAKEIVPEGEFVLNDPRDGSTWMFATEGLRPFFGGMSVVFPTDERPTSDGDLLLLHLDEIATDDEVREIVEENGIEYVIVGEGWIHGLERAEGFDDLEDNPAFELVEEVGGSQLFRIVG